MELKTVLKQWRAFTAPQMPTPWPKLRMLAEPSQLKKTPKRKK